MSCPHDVGVWSLVVRALEEEGACPLKMGVWPRFVRASGDEGACPHDVGGLGRSNTMGGLVGWKLTVQVEELTNVVYPSVIRP